jgi:hypothetical protein
MITREDRKKILEESLSDKNGEGFKMLGEILGEEIRRKIQEGRRLRPPRRNLVELTKECLGFLCRKDFGKDP